MTTSHGRVLAPLLAAFIVAGCDSLPPPPAAELAAGTTADPAPVDLDDHTGGSADPMVPGAPVPAAALDVGSDHLPGEPDPILTPGALNPDVRQATIASTICVSGWTTTIRPPTSYTNALKGRQIAQYGYPVVTPSAYEEDHLIPLQLGGAPSDPLNLWPQPYTITLGDGRETGARVKDAFETALKRKVCAGTITLADAQAQIGIHWVHAYYAIPYAIGGPTAPSPSPLRVAVGSVTSPAVRGSPASLAASTAPGAACQIEVGYASGPSKAAGLEPRTADSTGAVNWTWRVGAQTQAGAWPIAVTCSSGDETATTGTTLVVK